MVSTPTSQEDKRLFVASQCVAVPAMLMMWFGVVLWVTDSILATLTKVVEIVTQTEPFEDFIYYQDSDGPGRMMIILFIMMVAMALYALGLIQYRSGNSQWKVWMGVLGVISVWVYVKVIVALVQVLFL